MLWTVDGFNDAYSLQSSIQALIYTTFDRWYLAVVPRDGFICKIIGVRLGDTEI